MKSIRLNIVTAATVILMFATGATGEPYSLNQYLTEVEKNNPELALSNEQLEAANQTVKQKLSVLLPTVGLSGSYTRNLNDVKQSKAVAASTTAVNGVYPITYQYIDSNYDNEVTAGIGITQNLVDAESVARYAQARKKQMMQQAETEYTGQLVLTAAKKLYAQVQLLEAIVEVKKETVRTAEAVYHNIEKKYNVGTSTELDLRMAEVDWKSNISAEVEAEKNKSLAMMSLKTLAGMPQERKVELTEKREYLPNLPGKAKLPEVLSSRLDYRAQMLAKEAVDIGYRASLAAFLPKVIGNFTYAYGQYGGYEGQDDWDAYDYTAASIGLKVTIPLFTGGYRLSLIKSAEINQKCADIRIRQKRDAIEQDLESFELQMDEAKKQVESAKALEAASVRALTIAKASLESGMGTQLEVSQAMSNAAGARVSLQNAIYVYRSAYYDWQFASGNFKTE